MIYRPKLSDKGTAGSQAKDGWSMEDQAQDQWGENKDDVYADRGSRLLQRFTRDSLVYCALQLLRLKSIVSLSTLYIP